MTKKTLNIDSILKNKRFIIELTFLVVCVIMIVLLPSKSAMTSIGWLGLALVIALATFFTILVITDVMIKNGIKNVVAFSYLFLLVLLFVVYSNARWNMIGKIFFNFEIMTRTDPAYGNTTQTNWDLMASGLIMTLKIFIYSAALATIFGLFLAIVRTMVNDFILNGAIIIFVNICRSLPMLVMLILVYSALPYTGIVLSAEVSGVLTLGLIEGAFLCETFRAGINSVHAVQTEASRALGLSGWQTIRKIVMPQAVIVILPPYMNSLVGLMKATALCAPITIFELMKTAQQIQAWYANPTPVFIAAMSYIILLLPMTRLATSLEKKYKHRY